MDTFIKKIFDGKAKNGGDEMTHIQFQKFSKGTFWSKAVVNAKKSGNKFTINTTYEYANELVYSLAEKLGNNKTKVTGAVVTIRDLKGEFNFKDIKQFAGVKKYVLDNELSGNEIIALINKFPLAFFALSFEVGETILKIKPKSPKSAKPSTKTEDKPKADFCKLITTDNSIVKSIIFDFSSFKKIEIQHNFIITDIILPKGESDFAKMRELAKRKGKIERIIEVDGKKEKKEIEFLA